MGFAKTTNGKVDPAIYKAGRTRKEDERTKREIHDQELIRVLRKLKSHIPKAIMTAATILDRDEAKPIEKIQASKFLMENYLKIIGNVYDVEDEAAIGEEIQKDNSPVFSLTMIKSEE